MAKAKDKQEQEQKGPLSDEERQALTKILELLVPTNFGPLGSVLGLNKKKVVAILLGEAKKDIGISLKLLKIHRILKECYDRGNGGADALC